MIPVGLLLLFIMMPLMVVTFNWIRSDKVQGADAGERKRIMEMVEAGKISADEGKELLNALGNSTALKGQDKFSRADIVILIGAALVVLGFFMPWIYINMSNISGMFGQGISGYQAGYHTKTIGWAVFILAIMSVIPVFVTPKNYLYKISMLQIFLTIIGIVLVFSILIQAGEKLGIGLIVCLDGFIVALVASCAKFKQLAA
jgi:hypothetical protein